MKFIVLAIALLIAGSAKADPFNRPQPTPVDQFGRPIAGPSSSGSCRWVGINWTCDRPNQTPTTCRWVGQNWVCDHP